MNKFILAGIFVLFLVILGTFALKKSDLLMGAMPQNLDNWTITKKQDIPKKEDVKKPADKPALPLPTTYAESLIYAKNKEKKLLLVFKTASCVPCAKMNNDTFKNKEVQSALKEQGICLLYYLNPDIEPEVAKKYGVYSVPKYIVIDANEKIYKSGLGYLGPEEFKSWLK